VNPSPLVPRLSIGVLYQPRMIDDNYDCGAIGGMNDWQGSRRIRRKLDAASFWSLQKPHMISPGLEPRPPRGNPADNRLSCGTLY
jgi:hypothetical protein